MSLRTIFHKELMDEFLKNNQTIKKGMPGYDLFVKAEKIMDLYAISNDAYLEKPYLISTQNQNYLNVSLPEHANNACIILSPGDTLLELVSRNVKNIVAIDTNDLQVLIFKLRLASLLTLSHNDFCKFLIDKDNYKFMSRDIFNSVKEGFSKEDEGYLNVWENLFRINSRYELSNEFFKNVGGKQETIINSLPYLQNKHKYYEIRDKIKNVNIEIKIMSILDYLINNPDKKFNYIDITNILLFIYQLECNHNKDKFKTKILELRKIFEQNLNNDGVLVLDYFFGIDFDDLCEEEILNAKNPAVNRIYQISHELLTANFDIESFQIDPQINCFGDKQDRVLLTRKK